MQPMPVPKHVASLEELIAERSKYKTRLNKLVLRLREARRYDRMIKYVIENKDQKSELEIKQAWQSWKKFQKSYDRSGSPASIRKTMASNLRSEIYQKALIVKLELAVWQYADYIERLDKKIKNLQPKKGEQ